MALIMTAVILAGFGFEVPAYVIHPKVPRPAIMWVHGITMLAWLAIYVTQTALVDAKRIATHRRLGMLGLSLAAVMVPLMLVASWVMDRFDLIYYPGPSRDADISFLALQSWDALSFGALVAVAASMRKQPEFHRRLMFLATCTLTDAGFGRLPMPWGPVGTHLDQVWVYALVDILIAIVMLRDWRMSGRIHRVFWWSLPAILVGQASVSYLMGVHPRWWVATASTLLGLA